MPLPRSILRVSRDGSVKYTSSILKGKYTLEELSRAALREIGKVVTLRSRTEVRGISNNSLRRSRRVKNAFQYWNRKRTTDLIVGIKHDTWYGVKQELGLDGQPKRDILRKTVMKSINDIKEITSQYLGNIEDEAAAQRLIDENAEVLPDDQDD
jgi:hypothetical protein